MNIACEWVSGGEGQEKQGGTETFTATIVPFHRPFRIVQVVPRLTVSRNSTSCPVMYVFARVHVGVVSAFDKHMNSFSHNRIPTHTYTPAHMHKNEPSTNSRGFPVPVVVDAGGVADLLGCCASSSLSTLLPIVQ